VKAATVIVVPEEMGAVMAAAIVARAVMATVAVARVVMAVIALPATKAEMKAAVCQASSPATIKRYA
jgi:hypothetical protein